MGRDRKVAVHVYGVDDRVEAEVAGVEELVTDGDGQDAPAAAPARRAALLRCAANSP
jgi:hypothetical protein